MRTARHAARGAVSRLYRWKRERGIGDELFARHPALAARLMSLLRPFKHRTAIDGQGHRLLLDPGDYLGLSIVPVYEPDVTAFLSSHVDPGDLVVDVGANIGYFTLLMAKLVGPDGVVVAFEPEPANFDLLRANVVANGYGNVDLRQAAVADRSGEVTLYLSEENPGDHRLAPAPGRLGVPVRACALDDELAGIGPCRLVKLDVQGGEAGAVRGMRRVLAESSDVAVVLELSPGALRDAGEDPRAMLDELAGHGLVAFRLDAAGRPSELSARELAALSGPGRAAYANVVFARPATAARWA